MFQLWGVLLRIFQNENGVEDEAFTNLMTRMRRKSWHDLAPNLKFIMIGAEFIEILFLIIHLEANKLPLGCISPVAN